MSTSTKPLWPTIGPHSLSIHAHLTPNIYTSQAIIQAIETNDKKDKQLPIDILLSHLKALKDTLVQAKDNTLDRKILQEIHSLTDIVK